MQMVTHILLHTVHRYAQNRGPRKSLAHNTDAGATDCIIRAGFTSTHSSDALASDI